MSDPRQLPLAPAPPPLPPRLKEDGRLPPCPIELRFPGQPCLFRQHVGHADVVSHREDGDRRARLPIELRHLSLRTVWRHGILQPRRPRPHPPEAFLRRPPFSAAGVTLFHLRAVLQPAEDGCGYHALHNALLVTRACLQTTPSAALERLQQLQDPRAFEETRAQAFDLLMQRATSPRGGPGHPGAPSEAGGEEEASWTPETVRRGILERAHLGWLLQAPQSPLPGVGEVRRAWADAGYGSGAGGHSPHQDGEAAVISAWPEITPENVERLSRILEPFTDPRRRREPFVHAFVCGWLNHWLVLVVRRTPGQLVVRQTVSSGSPDDGSSGGDTLTHAEPRVELALCDSREGDAEFRELSSALRPAPSENMVNMGGSPPPPLSSASSPQPLPQAAAAASSSRLPSGKPGRLAHMLSELLRRSLGKQSSEALAAAAAARQQAQDASLRQFHELLDLQRRANNAARVILDCVVSGQDPRGWLVDSRLLAMWSSFGQYVIAGALEHNPLGDSLVEIAPGEAEAGSGPRPGRLHLSLCRWIRDYYPLPVVRSEVIAPIRRYRAWLSPQALAVIREFRMWVYTHFSRVSTGDSFGPSVPPQPPLANASSAGPGKINTAAGPPQLPGHRQASAPPPPLGEAKAKAVKRQKQLVREFVQLVLDDLHPHESDSDDDAASHPGGLPRAAEEAKEDHHE